MVLELQLYMVTERDHVLAQFKAGRTPILVATDVAARGLDVKDIRCHSVVLVFIIF